MHVEVVARPGTEEQFNCLPSAVSLGDPAASAARIIVVFTTAAEATAALTFARFLAVSDTRAGCEFRRGHAPAAAIRAPVPSSRQGNIVTNPDSHGYAIEHDQPQQQPQRGSHLS
jgi:hypothetical protein